MTADERIANVEEQLKEALEQIHVLQEELAAAHKCIEELEKQKTPSAALVKANVKKPQVQEKKPRKKRDPKHNHGRPRWVPTQIVEHRIVSCPICDLRLGGISLARVREVIEMPEPLPVAIIQHRIFKGWCAQCQKWHEAPVDLHAEVLGQGRLAVRPLVITRKISGGSRSPKGSVTSMGLASLFGTWMAQGLNPFFQCLAFLTAKTSLG